MSSPNREWRIWLVGLTVLATACADDGGASGLGPATATGRLFLRYEGRGELAAAPPLSCG